MQQKSLGSQSSFSVSRKFSTERAMIVESTTASDTLTAFVKWIGDEVKSDEHDVVLCAHNGEEFDMRVLLLAAMVTDKASNLEASVIGFC